MDLKNKRILGIAYIILFGAVLALYTRIGGMGMIYAAAGIELFFVVTYFFLGGIPETMEYMIRIRKKREQHADAGNVWKAGLFFGIGATVITEVALLFVNKLVVGNTNLLYVDKLLQLSMIAVPFLAALQVLLGIMQSFLDKAVSSISALVFAVCMVIATTISAMMLGDYGAKVASLMQSMKMEHFYVVIGLVPGVIIGALGAVLFLAVIWLTHRDQIHLANEQHGQTKESVLKLTWELCKNQFSEVVAPCLKHVPILLLLWLSLEEIAAENYLFGNFYGAILPLFGILWQVFDLGLVRYKKRLYMAYRRKMDEQFYRDLKAVLCYVIIHSVAIFAFTLALHKSYLAIWNLQTFVSFMQLALASSVIGMLGLPCLVLCDVLKYRGMQSRYVFSVLAGTVVSAIGSAFCVKFFGTGILLYVVCISLQLFVTTVFAAWSVSHAVGIHYISVIIRTAGCIICTLFIAVVLYGIQVLSFTALGGLGTLIICVVIGSILLFFASLALHVYEKEELENLPFSFITKFLAKIF